MSPLLDRLEQLQPNVLGLEDLRLHLRAVGMHAEATKVAQDLRTLGWLLPLRTQGHWQYAPTAHAGGRRARDPFIELRATLQRRRLNIAVAHESAAWLHGLSSREPDKHVLAAHRLAEEPPAALRAFRIIRTNAVQDPEEIQGVPVWSVATLLVHMSIAPMSFHDWPNVAGWLGDAFARVSAAELECRIPRAAAPARVRLAYLAHCAKAAAVAERLMHEVYPRSVVSLGPLGAAGRYVPDFGLVDSLLLPHHKRSSTAGQQ